MSKIKFTATAIAALTLGLVAFASSASAGCGYVQVVTGYNYGYPIYGNSVVCTPDLVYVLPVQPYYPQVQIQTQIITTTTQH